jgi:hypothetical protein
MAACALFDDGAASKLNARQVRRMSDKTTELKQQTRDRLNLAYEVSDEVLESAAMVVSVTTKNLTLTFCSTPWTCPMSVQCK